jgi:acetyltransferase
MTLTLQLFNAKDIRNYQKELVELLQEVVDSGASVGFLPPLSTQEASAWWLHIAEDVLQAKRYVMVALVEGEVAGTVQIGLAGAPNSQHRADLQKLLVHSRFRRRGIASALMNAIETHAKSIGRTLLVLDTHKDSAAEPLYIQLGWTRVGEIPHFALLGDELITTVFFYKYLA